MARRTEEFYDHNTDTLYIRHVEDVEPHIEHVKEERNHMDNGFSPKRHYRKIGSIPLIFVEKILREKGINIMENSPEAQREVRKILNEFNAFRTVDKPV